MNILHDTILSYWTSGRKIHRSPKGWLCANAICCSDNRHRAGIKFSEDESFGYSCFNCGFKAYWSPNMKIGPNVYTLLTLLNVPDDIISSIRLANIRLTTQSNILRATPRHSIQPIPLPTGAIPLTQLNTPPTHISQFLHSRGLYLDDYPFYWTPLNNMANRLIIPYYYKHQTVGYTARSTNDSTPKYLSAQNPGFIFNLHAQSFKQEFIIITEGPIDAISIQATAIMGNTISTEQHHTLKSLNKPIIVLPDRDTPGKHIIQQALDLEYQVSFPPWPPNIKDANDAIRVLGRTTTLYLIHQYAIKSPIKIQLTAKTWFS